jgi:hypothetical protein
VCYTVAYGTPEAHPSLAGFPCAANWPGTLLIASPSRISAGSYAIDSRSKTLFRVFLPI